MLYFIAKRIVIAIGDIIHRKAIGKLFEIE